MGAGEPEEKPQVAPLRFHGTPGLGGMTYSVEKPFQERSGELQSPPLRSPRFPVEFSGFGKLHAPFSTEKPHTWLLRVP